MQLKSVVFHLQLQIKMHCAKKKVFGFTSETHCFCVLERTLAKIKPAPCRPCPHAEERIAVRHR